MTDENLDVVCFVGRENQASALLARGILAPPRVSRTLLRERLKKVTKPSQSGYSATQPALGRGGHGARYVG